MILPIAAVTPFAAELASAATSAVSGAVSGAVAGGAEALSGGRSNESSFSDVLRSMGTQTVSNLRGAEVQSFKAIAGEADTRELVDALMAAEQSLQTAIAVRDKLVTAYLEITRMQI